MSHPPPSAEDTELGSLMGGIACELKPAETPALFAIPVEILEGILLFCHPRDVVRFSTTCRFAEHLIHRSADHYFWRQLFLVLFDDPRHAVNPRCDDPASFNWKGELTRRMVAERTAFLAGAGDLRSVLETFVSVADEALPASNDGHGDSPASLNLEWLDNVLRNSRILDASFPRSAAQFGNKLNAFVALSLKEETEDTVEELRALRTQSRCFVYDLRNYHPRNHWGPYLSNGTVNWTAMAAIINVVENNLREQRYEELPRPPLGLHAIRAFSAPGTHIAPDWAGVAGSWRRYVCFLDYRDLFAFNFSEEFGDEPDAAFFDEYVSEATRLIYLDLHLIPREKLRVQFPGGGPPVSKDTRYPPIYFAGTSRGAAGQEATVQGFVHMGPDHIPRWRFTSIYDQHPQWSSEGAQVGGVGSAMGVVGAWSAFSHGPEDPAGPFWLWKVSKEPNV